MNSNEIKGLDLNKLKTLKDVNVEGKVVMLRTDYNVPIVDGNVINDFRIRKSLPTIRYLLENNVKRIIILSHLKNPKGYDKAFTLEPVKNKLQELLQTPVEFVDLEKLVGSSGKITLVENIRFWKEKENDSFLAKFLSEFADIYVFDAFSVAHRKHTTTWMLMEYLPTYAGFLVEEEINALSKIFQPEKPFLAIIGGAKISTKLNTIKALCKIADYVYVGGAMIFTIMKALGMKVGKSLIEPEMIETIKNEWNEIKDKIILPKDFIVAKNPEAEAILTDKIPDDSAAYDIGKKSIDELKELISKANFVVWNGPMGMFENERFENGTKELVKALEQSNAYRIVGGGETITALEAWSSIERFDHVSTGGGAMLKFIENPMLPGLVHLFKE